MSRNQTQTSSEVDKKVHREFLSWFARRILNDHNPHSPQFRALAIGPLDHAKRFTAYNGYVFKFCTVSRYQVLQTQNSGVFDTFRTRSYASSSDSNMQFGGVPYYGKLVDVVELNYQGHFTVTLFKCLWANTTTSRGLTTDDLGITSVNFSRRIHTGQSQDDEPYILASEAHQVYYVQDERYRDWNMVVHLKPRDLYDMGDGDNITYENEPLHPANFENFFPEGDDNLPIVR